MDSQLLTWRAIRFCCEQAGAFLPSYMQWTIYGVVCHRSTWFNSPCAAMTTCFVC